MTKDKPGMIAFLMPGFVLYKSICLVPRPIRRRLTAERRFPDRFLSSRNVYAEAREQDVR